MEPQLVLEGLHSLLRFQAEASLEVQVSGRSFSSFQLENKLLAVILEDIEQLSLQDFWLYRLSWL